MPALKTSIQKINFLLEFEHRPLENGGKYATILTVKQISRVR